MRNHVVGSVLVSVVCLVSTVAPCALGQEDVAGPQDPAELEAFIDGLMTAHLAAYHSAGATVSVAKDGAVFFSKGYGTADVKAKKKVEPDKTLFRIGSVSKLFVWTAVMQLVERGELDLDEDVNTYLKGFQIPPYNGTPVTVAELMTHSAGFEDRVVGLFARSAESLAPLEEVLAKQMPARVRPPGVFSSYSNHGTALAMYVVECITGMEWQQYIQVNILDPLHMDHTSFAQPPPEPLGGDLSKGYSSHDDQFKEESFEFIPLAPVGAGASTANDMAKFMIAHLQLGQLGGARILKEATARQMQSALFRQAPQVSPMAHGFIIQDVGGLHMVGHGGDTQWFHTELVLLPEHHLGLFVSHNTSGGAEARSMLVRQFMERYYPAPEVPTAAPGGRPSKALRRFTGSYRSNRYSHTTIGKLGALETIKVETSRDGGLLLEGKRYLQVSPLTFRGEDGRRTLVFKEDDKGGITHMFFSDLPIIAFEKLSLLERPASQALFLGATAVVLLSAFVLWPVAALVRRHYRIKLDPGARLPRGAKLAAWMAAALFLVFLLSFALVMRSPMEVVYGPTPMLYAVLSLPLAAAVLALASLVCAAISWRRRAGRLMSRAFYTLVTLSFFVLLAQLNYWKVLGFRF